MEPEQPKRRRGRPPGSAVTRAQLRNQATEQARLEGKLPHEILLDIARGTPMIQSRMEWDPNTETFKPVAPVVMIPDLEMRRKAASDAAPYFAPKLSAIELLQGLTDDGLDEVIAMFAAEAGVSFAAAREGAASSGQPSGVSADNAPANRPDSDELGDEGGAPAQ